MNQNLPRIKDFYKDQTVLITGVTGFVGKYLLEKLLRSCDVRKVYVLTRSKKTKSSQERLEELLQHQLYENVTWAKSKVYGVDGDLIKPNFDLSQYDRKMIADEVNIVFHCAASVKLNDNLSNALRTNTFGTESLYQLCTEMKQLKRVVYVSTIYLLNRYFNKLTEEIQPSPVSNVREVLEEMDNMELMNNLERKLVPEQYFSTYSLSKLMAELVSEQYAVKLPLTIVRLSIVSSSLKEPYPGWVDDDFNLLAYCLSSVGTGILKVFLALPNAAADLMPVDLCADSLLVAAWHSTYFRNNELLPFYNCGSGDLNPISWRTLVQLIGEAFSRFPSKHRIFHPSCTVSSNVLHYYLTQIIASSIIAKVYDARRLLSGKRPKVSKLVEVFNKTMEVTSYVTLYHWNIISCNLQSMSDVLDKEERKIFNTDPTSINWQKYLNDYCLGLHRHVFKDTSIQDRCISKL